MLEYSEYVKIIDDCKRFPNKLKALRLSAWGEPLLHPDYIKMLKYANNAEVAGRIEIFTNAVLLTREISDGLIKYGMNKMIISIEALSDEGYYEICGRHIDFPDLIDNLKYLYENKSDTLIMHIKIADMGLRGKDDTERFFQIFGDICDEISVDHIVPIPVESAARAILANMKNENLDKTKGWDKIADRKVCPFIFTSLLIQHDMRVLQCNRDIWCEESLGDVRTQSLSDIWNGDKHTNLCLSHLKQSRYSVEFCRDCSTILYTSNDNIDDCADVILNRYGKNRGL
jgi:radical SAM protein with 4Fe4S-binding SPASM domain